MEEAIHNSVPVRIVTPAASTAIAREKNEIYNNEKEDAKWRRNTLIRYGGLQRKTIHISAQSCKLSENYVDYKPQGQLQSNSAVHCYVPNDGSKYIDLQKTKLIVKVNLSRNDGAAMTGQAVCVPVNFNTTFSMETDGFILAT